MNKQEYREYQESVERNTAGLEHVSTGLNSKCLDCFPDAYPCPHCGELIDPDTQEPPDAENTEGSFSCSSCDCCDSTLGGNREPAHGIDKDGNLVHMEVCTDCVYYLNYGRLDDQSMIEVEELKQ